MHFRYRHMDIGTGKVSAADRILIRHHMSRSAGSRPRFSAGDYQRLAREALGRIREREHIPFVVGGTGLYLRALIEGLFEGPSRSEVSARRMRKIIKRRNAGILHRALRRIDPQSAARIAESDAERIIRAYEVTLSAESQ